MESRDQTHRMVGLTKSRIEALTDGIFAFAMTLLVTGMDLPSVAHPLAEGGVQNILMELLPDFVHYVIAFITLAGFWFIHHVQYHHIRYIDRRLLWINIMSLLFVALVPFSTSLAGDFPQDRIASLELEANLFVIGLMSSWQWSYACRNHRLVDPSLDKATVAAGKRRGTVVPAVSGFAMMLSILNIPWSLLVYLLVPVTLGVIPSGWGHEKLSANDSSGTN